MITNRFETILADTQIAKDLHYRVRYTVFCQETGYEDAARFPDCKERDEFDSQAAHFIIWDRQEREWVGAMRLVPSVAGRLPSELVCNAELRHLARRRQRSVEFSRLCVLGKHRKTESAFRFGMTLPDDDPQGRDIPVFFRQEDNEIFLRLLLASFAWGKANAVDYCYFIVNRALARVLQRFGIPLEVVGSPVEHRGLRTPHCYNVHSAYSGMLARLPGFERLARHGSAYVPYSGFVGQPAAVEKVQTSGQVCAFPSEIVLGNQLLYSARVPGRNLPDISGKVA